ncbi:MAG TPA: hypothetical protein VK249_31345 [Anaerolineales bacterium]|nr:hypothetical protein [Anaerolineales bacterium]
MKARKNIYSSLVTVFVLVLQLMSPALVHADDETPPPTSEASAKTSSKRTPPALKDSAAHPKLPAHPVHTQRLSSAQFPTLSPTGAISPTSGPVETTTPPEISTPVPTDLSIVPAETDARRPSSEAVHVTSTPIPAEPMVVPIETSSPTPEPSAVPVNATESASDPAEAVEPTEIASTDDPTLTEVLQELPEGTAIIVLDANGQLLPLGSQEAASALTSSDPVWCPGTQAPTPGANGCSASYTTLAGLVAAIGATTHQNGTIWITSGNVGDVNAITINGTDYSNWANFALTLQGGWSGVSGDTNIGSNSVFSVPISILNWNNNITINNLTIQNINTGTGLTIDGSSNVTINQSNFVNNQTGLSATFRATQEGTVRIFNLNNINFENNSLGLFEFLSCAWLNENRTNVAFINNSQNSAGAAVDCPLIYVPPTPTSILPAPPLSTYSQGNFRLTCLGRNGFAVNLPNGDLVNIFCPVSGLANIHRLDNTTLPANLPTGYTYASAFSLDILQGGKPIPVITEGGYINASFVAQPLQPGNTYSILYWNPENNSWVTLKDFLLDGYGKTKSFDLFPGVAADTRKIISGVKLVTRNSASRVEVSANFPGIFVLAQH